ncbi:tape measure protein [Gordonia phage Mollymur]|uniref:Tape measure protein n=1 Tax=Gordonia phage Mollymur TaxID=2590895 RepID=A0A4Y6EBP0_9CAUD|nr:tail length tape measure protein [Gordonia phage Mollymur]QDF15390.1 tape measure protein [Gordonia phage Mollymur]
MALTRYQAGTAFVRVKPDFTDFGKVLERKVQDNLNNIAARAQIDKKSVDRARAQLRSLANENASPTIAPKVDKRAMAQAEKAVGNLLGRHSHAVIEAEVRTIKAEQQLARLTGKRHQTIEVEIDSKSAMREFAKARQEISKVLERSGPLNASGVKSIQRVMSRALRVDAVTNDLLPRKAEWDRAAAEAARLKKIIKSGPQLSTKQLAAASEGYVKAAQKLADVEKRFAAASEAAATAQKEAAAADARHLRSAKARARIESGIKKSRADVARLEREYAGRPEALEAQGDRVDTLRRRKSKYDDLVAKAPRGQGANADDRRQYQLEDRIASAMERLPKDASGFVSTSDLRKALKGVTREEFDQAMVKFQRRPGVSLIPQEDQKTLTDQQRRDAVKVGTQPSHLFGIEGTSWRDGRTAAPISKTQQQNLDRQARATRELAEAEEKLEALRKRSMAVPAELQEAKQRVEALEALKAQADDRVDRNRALSKRAARGEREAADELRRATSVRQNAETGYNDKLTNLTETRAAVGIKAERELKEAREAYTKALDEEAAAQARYTRLLPKQANELKRLQGAFTQLRSSSISSRDDLFDLLNRAGQVTQYERTRAKLTVTGEESNTALSALQRKVPTRIQDSRLDKDVVAMQAASRAASTYDRVMAQLEQRTFSLTQAERAMAEAERAVAHHRAEGTIATERGEAALRRYEQQMERVGHLTRQRNVVSEAAGTARTDYNATARNLENRINLNPLTRFIETVDHQAKRVIDGFTERLIFAGRLLSAVSSLGMAAGAGVAVLGAVNLVPLVGAIGQVAGVLATLPALAAGAAAGIAAIAVGFSGIGDAFKAATKLTDARTKAAGPSSATASRNAQRQVEQAQKAQARTAQQGARQIEDAEKSIQRAQKSSQDAQKDLTRERKAARQEIEEMNRSLKGLALDEEDAALSVEEARKALRETLADPDADGTDRKRARLSYRQAIQNLSDVRYANKQTRGEIAEANRLGVNGSERVVQAQERATSSQEQLAEAQKNLAQTQKDVADANADAADRVAQAQESMAEAASGGSNAIATAAYEYEEALKKLAPNAAALVDGTTKMGDAWTDVRKATSQELLSGMARDLVEIGQVQLPILRTGLSDVAGELNGGIRVGMGWLKSNRGAADMTTILGASADGAGALSRAVSHVTTALLGLSAESSNTFPRFGRAVEDASLKFARFIENGRETNSINEYMGRIIDRTKVVGGLFIDLGRIVGGVFSGSMSQGESMLRNFSEWADRTADFLQGVEGQQKVADFFSRVNDLFGNALFIVDKLADALVDVVIPAFSTVSSIFGPALSLIVGLLAGLEAQTGVLKYLLTGYLALRIVNSIFGRIGAAVSNTNNVVGRQVGILGQMRTAWVNAGVAAQNTNQRAGRLAAVHQVVANHSAAVTRMGRQYIIAEGHAAKLNRTAGALAYARSGVAQAMSGIGGALGGPVGIALLAGTVGLGMWASAAQKAKAQAEAFTDASTAIADAQEGVSKALRDSRGAVDSSVMGEVGKQVQAEMDKINAAIDNGPSWWERLATKGFDDDAWSLGKGWMDGIRERSDLKSEMEGLKSVLDDLEISSDRVSAAIGGSDEEWVNFRRTLQGAGPEGERLLGIFQGQRDALMQQRDQVLAIQPGYLDLADAIGVLADKSATAEERATALSRALDALTPGKEEQDAVYAFGESLDAIKQRIESMTETGGFGLELVNPDGSVNTLKENGRTIYDSIREGRDKLAALRERGEDTGEFWQQYTDDIIALGAAAGITEPQIRAMLDTYNATPDRVDMVIGLTGASDVLQDLVGVRMAFADLKPGQTKTMQVELKDRNSQKVIEDLGGKVRWINMQEGIAEVTLDSTALEAGFGKSVALMQALNILTSTATANLDTNTFEVDAQNAKRIIDVLDQYRGDATIGAVIKELESGVGLSFTALDNLEKEHTEPTVGADITPLQAAIDQARKELDALKNGDPSPDRMPRADRPEEYTDERGNKHTRWYDENDNERHRVVGPNGEELNPDGTPKKKIERNSVGGSFYLGGRLPLFAAGGRMPSSGPGTESRDGIFAVGPDGVPRARVDGGEWVINAAMSQKYHALLALINADRLAGFANGGQLPGGGQPGMFGLQMGALGDPFAPLAQGVGALGSMFSSALTGEAIPAWQQFGAQLQGGAATLISPALNGVTGLVTQLTQKFTTAAATVAPTWTQMTESILGAKTSTIDPAFAGISGGITTVEAAFTNGVANIRTQWDGMRSATGDPVRFTIDQVFNQGLVGMWNSVADLIGATKMAPYVAKFATGGYVTGPGGPTDDKIPAMLSNGEFVLNARATRAAGIDNLRRFNSANGADGPQGMFGVGTGRMHYATGGLADTNSPAFKALQRAHLFAKKWSGTPYEWGGSFATHGGVDCSGYMSSIADVIQGGTGMFRKWATGAFPGGGNVQGAVGPQGFVKGLGAGFSIGVSGVHTAGTLGGVPGLPTVNVESGGGTGGGATYGPPAGGADQSQFPSQYHLPIVDGMFVSAGGGGGAAPDMGSIIRTMMDPGLQRMLSNARAFKGNGTVGNLPVWIANSYNTLARDKVIKLAEEITRYTGPAIMGGDVNRWRPMVIQALKRNGYAATDAEINAMLAQIQSESSGNPSAIQQVLDVNSGGNEAAGLLQIAKGTWPGVRDPSLPDDRLDPWANMNGALRYLKMNNLDLLSTWGHGHGYDRGGIFEDGTFGWNTSGKPEAVFTNRQWLQLDELVTALLNPKLFSRLVGETPVAATGSTPTPQLMALPPELGDAAAAAEPLHPEALALYKKYGVTPPEPTPPITEDLTTPEVPEEPEDPLANYSGPLADVLKKGQVIGQAANGLANPEAMARLGDIDHDYKRAHAIKQRLGVATKYRTDSENLASTLRAEGKEKEAAEIEAGIDAREREIAGGDPQKLAELATLADGEAPSVTLRQQAEEQFKQYLVENALGISESVLSAGMGAVGNSGAGDIIINGGVRTNSWKDAQRSIERSQKRKARQASRAGYR